MHPKNKMPFCKEQIKTEALVIEVCNKQLITRDQRYVCPRASEHMMKYKTGFCANKNCEGSAKKTHSGGTMPTCKWWMRCPCDCHKMFDMMYAQSGMTRVVVDNSGYEPAHSDFKMPSLEERMAMAVISNPSPVNVRTIVESPLPEAVPITMRRVFTPTPTGIAGRGELESWVKDECDVWIVETEDFACTPVYLAEAIRKTKGFVRPPSVGAISSVFERWTKMGFAIVEKKPTRFISYTEEGVRLGLDGLKELRKRSRKFEDAATRRGILR